MIVPRRRDWRLQQVILFVKPLEDGPLVLRGVSMEVLSAVTLCRVDKWGRGISPGWV